MALGRAARWRGTLSPGEAQPGIQALARPVGKGYALASSRLLGRQVLNGLYQSAADFVQMITSR